jgi:site-specific DNA-adenine methylase
LNAKFTKTAFEFFIYHKMAKIFPFPYFGAKAQLRKDILPQILSENFDVFIEPFCGSAEISLQLMKIFKEKNIKKTFILNDTCLYLISFHYLMKMCPEMLMRIPRITKEEFNKLRDRQHYTIFDLFTLWMNTRFYYLRFTRNGKFSNQWNNVWQFKKERVQECNELYDFHDIKFLNKDYKEILENLPPKSFIYLDPPYTKTMISYNQEFDIEEFKEMLKKIKQPWLLSYNEEIGFGNIIMDKVRKNQYSANYKKNATHKTDRRELLIVRE